MVQTDAAVSVVIGMSTLFKKMKTLALKSDTAISPLNLRRVVSSPRCRRGSAHHVVLPPHERHHPVSFARLGPVVLSGLSQHRNVCCSNSAVTVSFLP